MNVFDLLESIGKPASSVTEMSQTTRREVFNKLGEFGKKLALGTLAIGTASIATTQKAKAAHEGILEVLNFALLLEYLESEFYEKGLDANIMPSSLSEKIFMQIGKHEAQYVEFLKVAINSLGGTPIEKPAFDFTAKGAFRPFTDFTSFLNLAQAFEDTGVRAYKGQAANLMGNDDVLTAALQIHSVEARHAARVRRLRGTQSWHFRTPRNLVVPAVYVGEDNTMQGGVDVTTLTSVDAVHVMESFDEPLTKEEVLAIGSLFLA